MQRPPLLRNTRKTVAVSSAPPEGLASSFPVSRRVSAPFALLSLLASVSLAAPPTVTIKVDATQVENHVSPRMYAAFVEMMAEDVKWGMTAEMVHDRSFEEAPNYLD